jgi:predicted histidine transporter YuiF (NhaC family)
MINMMKERKIDRVLYYFCRLFGIVRNKSYIVFPDGSHERIYMKIIPTTIHDRNKNRDYNILGVVGEPINKAMIYYYIKLEELTIK